MINTDAFWSGFAGLWKTPDHVLGAYVRIVGGDILTSMPVSCPDVGENTTTPPHLSDRLSVLPENRQLILDKFPKLNRFLTGYDLRHAPER